MKKIIVILVAVLGYISADAQSAKVQSAINYLRNGKLDKAKENIDAAMTNPTTMDKAKTWFYYANVYLNIYMSQEEEYKNLAPDALEVAYNAYKKTKVLDTKEEFKNELQINTLIIAEQFFNKAVGAFEKTQYLTARDGFLTAKEINESYGGIDTLSTYYGGISAEYGGDTTNALNLFQTLIDAGYKEPNLYASTANIYKGLKQYDKGLEISAIGRQLFPDDFNIIIAETNLYLANGNSEMAIRDLQLALEKTQDNPTIFFAVGVQYNIISDDTSKTEKVREESFLMAEKSYLDAIRLDENYYDANYNLGALYV
ncbi:MAG: hypothetical protein PHD61_11700, partial [Bacteroidales bacterium]|nr:hypothetical protein [Bacteroidales bacterium]